MNNPQYGQMEPAGPEPDQANVEQPQPAPGERWAAPAPAWSTATSHSVAHESAQDSASRAASHGTSHATHQPNFDVPFPTGSHESAPAAATESRTPRQRRVWPAVLTASLASAALATGGTLGVVAATGAFDPPSLSSVQASSAIVPASQLTEGTVERVAAAVRDSVVAIEVSTMQGGGEGSGVILDSDGHILTNDHVVDGARSIRVTLADGRVLGAQIIGTDPSTDLAVIALDSPPSDLVPATLGDSAELTVGQDVVAVGNPLGLSSTVTSGIISALDRPVTTTSTTGSSAVVTNAIQVDAAINPGNSGGPLFDLGGNAIGITSSIASLSQGQSGSIGLGFAIPIDLASRVADEIIATGSAQHAFLGVTLMDGEAEADGVTRTGALIRDVVPGSAAASSGLVAGDVVVAIDGTAVSGADSLTGFVRALTPGSDVTLGVVSDGTYHELEVGLGEA